MWLFKYGVISKYRFVIDRLKYEIREFVGLYLVIVYSDCKT